VNILYSKYNRNRLPEFQIETTICEENGMKYVRKRPLNGSAARHIQSIHENGDLLRSMHERMGVANAELDCGDLKMEFIHGRSIDSLLSEKLIHRDMEAFKSLILQVSSIVVEEFGASEQPLFQSSKRFEEIFGITIELNDVLCCNIANLDLTFDNMIVGPEGKWIVIDYEWVFTMQVPVKYLLYRCLNEFYRKYIAYMEHYFPEKSRLFALLDIREYEMAVFDQLEAGFQKYVCGDNTHYEFNKYYFKNSRTIQETIHDETLSLRTELAHRENISNELAQIKNSRGYKLLERYYKVRDKLLPMQSKRRKALKLSLHVLVNFKKIRRYATISNMRKLAYYSKRGNFSALLAKIESKVSAEIHSLEQSQEGNDHLLQVLKKQNRTLFEGNVPTVDIVIPIYNAYDYTKKCIEKVYRNTEISYNLYLINDCSPDPRIKELLDSLLDAERPRHMQNLVVVHNEENLGFVRNVNKGMSLSSNHVILLNSDTEVPENWATRLMMPILLNRKIASATPFSNCATICSFPNFCEDNELPDQMSVDMLDALFQAYGSNEPIELPTAVGFCMAINREVLDEIGLFDAEAFGKGYGEENDWCQRAQKAGYSDVLVPNLFVYHKHGVSFNQHTDKKRSERMQESMSIIERRYPDYVSRVSRFIAQDPIKPVRQVIATSVTARNESHKEGVLLINHNLGGGSKLYQDQLIASNRMIKRIYTLELRGNQYVVGDKNQGKDFDYSFAKSEMNDSLFRELLQWMNIQHIFVNQLVTYPIFDLMEHIQGSGVKYTFFIHDFFSVCPSYFLIDSGGKYCYAETDTATCAKCLKKGLSTEPWIQMKASSIDIDQWRARFYRFLSEAHQVISPSGSAADIIRRYYPDLTIDIQEHTLLTPLEYTFNLDFIKQRELHVAFIGALGEYKGSNIVYELKDEIQKQGLPIRIKVIGITDRHQDRYVSQDGVLEVTGRYDNIEISKLLEKHKIGVVIIPSLCSETYSYTTSEAMLSGYPIITFDLGAPAERVRRFDAGWVVREMTVHGICQQLKQLLNDRDEIYAKAAQIQKTIRSQSLREAKSRGIV